MNRQCSPQRVDLTLFQKSVNYKYEFIYGLNSALLAYICLSLYLYHTFLMTITLQLVSKLESKRLPTLYFFKILLNSFPFLYKFKDLFTKCYKNTCRNFHKVILNLYNNVGRIAILIIRSFLIHKCGVSPFIFPQQSFITFSIPLL